MSASSALLQFTDSFRESMDKSHTSGVVYLDLKKAFDTVDHSLMLLKLTEYGVSTACLKWFRSYRSQISQQTSVGELSYRKEMYRLGVPQGSVLGPIRLAAISKILKHNLACRRYSNILLRKRL